ncbi:MAG: prepilin-type N-terminal cleavage/methylation domain-containing protein [Acidobacteriota bacterium]
MMLDRLRLGAERGFTLIELLVVIAIIGILAAISIPQFAAYRKRGYQAQVWSDIRIAATAQEAYLVDTNDYSDTLSGLKSRGYSQNTDVTMGVTGTSNQGFLLTAGHANCLASDSWTYDPAAIGKSVDGGPCS